MNYQKVCQASGNGVKIKEERKLERVCRRLSIGKWIDTLQYQFGFPPKEIKRLWSRDQCLVQKYANTEEAELLIEAMKTIGNKEMTSVKDGGQLKIGRATPLKMGGLLTREGTLPLMRRRVKVRGARPITDRSTPQNMFFSK